MRKVQAARYGITHYHATCSECDFTCGISFASVEERRSVQKEVRKHVRETGHRVTIESCTSTRYYPEME
jgi:hypothetical protein